MQMKTAWDINKTWLVRIKFLATAERAFLTKIALLMKQVVYAPGDRPLAPRLYIIFRGTVKYGGKNRGPGDTFGEEDCLLSGEHVVHRVGLCNTYVHANFVGPEELFATAEEYPEAHKALRKHVTRIALEKFLRRLGKEALRQKRLHLMKEGSVASAPGEALTRVSASGARAAEKTLQQKMVSIASRELKISPLWVRADGASPNPMDAASQFVQLLSDPKNRQLAEALTQLATAITASPIRQNAADNKGLAVPDDRTGTFRVGLAAAAPSAGGWFSPGATSAAPAGSLSC